MGSPRTLPISGSPPVHVNRPLVVPDGPRVGIKGVLGGGLGTPNQSEVDTKRHHGPLKGEDREWCVGEFWTSNVTEGVV